MTNFPTCKRTIFIGVVFSTWGLFSGTGTFMMVFKSLLKKQQFRNCIVDVELHSQNKKKNKIKILSSEMKAIRRKALQCLKKKPVVQFRT